MLEETSEVDDLESNENLLGLGLALTAAFVMSFCAVTSRLLKDVPTPVVIFYHTIGGIVMTSTYMMIDAWVSGNGTRLTEYTGYQYGVVLGASIFDCGALLMMTTAY